MKYFYLFTLLFVFSLPQLTTAAPYASSPKKNAVEEKIKKNDTRFAKFKKGVKEMSAKQKAKIDKRIAKLKKKMAAAEAGSGGIKLGLVIVLIGALIAVLGLAGVADLLITIGVIVLVVGLVLWLLDAI
ncbi:MAG: hypothetical protein AAGI23_02320 [Bacteroidota bacterium]